MNTITVTLSDERLSQMAFADEELYPTIVERAFALGFSLIQNNIYYLYYQ